MLDTCPSTRVHLLDYQIFSLNCFPQQFTTIRIIEMVHIVCADSTGSLDVRTGLSPWFAGPALRPASRWHNMVKKKFESSLAQVTACHKFDASHCRIKLIHCKLNPLDWTVSFDLRAQRVFLTYWGLMTPYGDTILVTIGSGNGFSPVWCRTIACRVGSIHLKNWNCSSIQSLELELKLVKLNWK